VAEGAAGLPAGLRAARPRQVIPDLRVDHPHAAGEAGRRPGTGRYLVVRTGTPPGDWISAVAGHLLGSLTDAELFAAAKSSMPSRSVASFAKRGSMPG